MTDDDREQFAILIQALASTKGKECDEPMLLGYWLGLSDLALEDLRSAVKKAIRESEWMPSPATLREMAGEFSAATRAVLAWQTVDKVVGRQATYYRGADFEDKQINATINSLGGWCAFVQRGDNPREWATFARQEFIKTYERLERVDALGERCGPCVGAIGSQEQVAQIACDYRTRQKQIGVTRPPERILALRHVDD